MKTKLYIARLTPQAIKYDLYLGSVLESVLNLNVTYFFTVNGSPRAIVELDRRDLGICQADGNTILQEIK